MDEPKAAILNLGARLRDEFNDLERRRTLYEQRWLRDLRQYKGIYDPEILAKLDKKRSKAFIRLTKVKVDTLCARLMDLLFPANGEKNWSISPSPKPSIDPVILERAVQQIQAASNGQAKIDIDKIINEIARKACENMEAEMEDQLVEDVSSPSYYEACRNVVLSALKFGTGILKGPLVEKRAKERFMFVNGKWQLVPKYEHKPFYEFVPIWDVYPDLDVSDRRQMMKLWQSYLFSKKELIDLAKRDDFDTEEIIKHLKDFPDGDASPKNYETEMRTMSDDEETSPDFKGRYRVLERWGYLEGKDLIEAGIELPEEDSVQVYSTNIWLLGEKVIKAVLAPIEGVDIPYYFYYFYKDETSIFGESLCSVMRDPQRVVNAAVRGMLDNAAITAGPQIGINAAALAPGEDPTDVFPFKVWMFKNVEDLNKAMKVFNLSSYTQEFMSITKFFFDFVDEVSTPRFMHGDEKVSGAGKTATGLSMLMGAVNINLKDMVRNFDNQITTPFIKALYYWNMKFNPKPDIKGDFQVKATGSSSLVAKEVQAQRMLNLVQITDNPRFQGRVDDKELLHEIFKSLDVPSYMVRSDQEYEQWKRRQMEMQAEAQAQANLQAIIKELEKRGVDPRAALTNMMAKAVMQQQGQPQGVAA
jgi:hypothetical protein